MVKKQNKILLKPEKKISKHRYCLKLRHKTQNNFPQKLIRPYSQKNAQNKIKKLSYSTYKIIDFNFLMVYIQ